MQTCCRRCGVLMRVIALMEKPDIIERILKYLNLWRLSYRSVYRANVRFGSPAACRNPISSRVAIGRKPVVPQRIVKNQNLNVCFHR